MGNIAVFRSFVSIAAALVIFLSGCATVAVEQWWDFPEGGIAEAAAVAQAAHAAAAAEAAEAAAQTRPDAEDDGPPAAQAAEVPAERIYAFSISPLAGFFWGQGEEQVYWNNYSDDLLSQLLWDLKPLWYLGVALDFSQREPLKKWGGFASLSAKFGIPVETGGMEDRDWQIPGSAVLTNYSWHHNNTDSTIVLDLTGGISIPLKSLFALRFSLGLSYLHFAWTARDGYYLYGVGGYSPPYGTVSGAVISYSQDWLLLPFGVSFAILPGSRFSGSLYFSAGPALRFIGRDTHHQKVNSGYYSEYVDSISGGYTFEPGGELLFSPNGHVSLGLQLSWRSITAASHGESYAAITGPGYPGNFVYLGNYAGGLFKAFDLGLGVKIRF
jgi:outer membrane protease